MKTLAFIGLMAVVVFVVGYVLVDAFSSVLNKAKEEDD
jgi:uncharacterized membrane protein